MNFARRQFLKYTIFIVGIPFLPKVNKLSLVKDTLHNDEKVYLTTVGEDSYLIEGWVLKSSDFKFPKVA